MLRFGNPYQTTEIIVLDYLFYLHKLGRSYSVLNTHRGMLLNTLPFFGNNWCDKCSLISRFMRGIFLKTPPLPRYAFTWDVTCVLKYLSSLFPLDTLPLKLLTYKVVSLIALANAPRAQTLVFMNLDYMLKEQHALIFSFPGLLKTSRSGHSYSLKIEHFKDEKLCPMHTLVHYLNITRRVRLTRSVFISYVTHKGVTTSTIARWLKSVLLLSGIDISKFSAHSFRGASCSKALSNGCTLQKILNTADWSGDKNFRKFYSRHSVSNDSISFTEAVLKKL